jgi:hypothetical protein
LPPSRVEEIIGDLLRLHRTSLRERTFPSPVAEAAIQRAALASATHRSTTFDRPGLQNSGAAFFSPGQHAQQRTICETRKLLCRALRRREKFDKQTVLLSYPRRRHDADPDRISSMPSYANETLSTVDDEDSLTISGQSIGFLIDNANMVAAS